MLIEGLGRLAPWFIARVPSRGRKTVASIWEEESCALPRVDYEFTIPWTYPIPDFVHPDDFVQVHDAKPTPRSKDQCKNGGHVSFGFKNQGECVAFVQRGPKP